MKKIAPTMQEMLDTAKDKKDFVELKKRISQLPLSIQQKLFPQKEKQKNKSIERSR